MPGDIAALLAQWRSGNADAGEAVIAQTYDELRRIARGGGGAVHETFDSSTAGAAMPRPFGEDDTEVVLDRLDTALGELSVAYPRAAQVVQLRYLAGLTTEETAAALDLSPGTVKRDWTFAKAWLAAALDADPPLSLAPARS